MKIVPLNAATLPVYCRELGMLLLDSIDSRTSLDYRQGLSRENAENEFYQLRGALDKGEVMMWIARNENGVLGTVRLELCNESEGLNRATLRSLLVHQRARRLGIGARLIAELEAAALKHRRGLISLDTQANTPAEAFFRAQGYRYLGELPDYICSADSYYHSAVIYYKRLFVVNQLIQSIAS